MAFHSFLSSHRLHWGASSAWSDPLPVQLDRILHEMSAQLQGAAVHLETGNEAAGLTGATTLRHIGFVDEPGP